MAIYDSYIKGAFKGCNGHSVYELVNGQIWEQSQYYYEYHYSYRPSVKIYQNNGYEMVVEGFNYKIPVKRIK